MSASGAMVVVDDLRAMIEPCCSTSISGTLALARMPSAVALPPPGPLTRALMVPGVLVAEELSSPETTMRGMVT